MGKKKKKNLALSKTSDAVSDSSNSLLDDIIKHLHLIKESKGLVIGSNAVLRSVERKSIDVVLLNSKRATSALYHALRLWCKNTDILFLQLYDVNTISMDTRICISSAYGIKSQTLKEKIFSNLAEKINTARKALQSHKQAQSSDVMTCQMCVNPVNKQVSENVDEKNLQTKSVLHEKHVSKKKECIENADSSLCGNFPNYGISDKISVSIT